MEPITLYFMNSVLSNINLFHSNKYSSPRSLRQILIPCLSHAGFNDVSLCRHRRLWDPRQRHHLSCGGPQSRHVHRHQLLPLQHGRERPPAHHRRATARNAGNGSNFTRK